jgi:hypothetical protein
VPVGDTIIIPFTANEWHYLHELIGDLQAAGNLTVLTKTQAGVETIKATFTLTSGQGITMTDEPGEDNRPRVEAKPGEDIILRITGGAFLGNAHWSHRF